MIDLTKNKYGLHIFIIIVLLAMSFYTITPVLYMVLLGAMIAYGLTPIANRIQTKIKYPSISILLAIILVIIPLILLFAYIFYEITTFADLFFNSSSLVGSDINQSLNILVQKLPAELQTIIAPNINSLSTSLESVLSYVLAFVVSLVKSFSDILVQLFVLICSIYYFTRDGDIIWENIFAFIPKEHKAFFDNTFFEIASVLKSIFYGHFLTAIIIGLLGGIGYYFLGYPFALFLGVVTGIFQLIPIFGPWIVYWSLAVYAIFVTGDIVQAILTIAWGFVLSLSDMYIRPALASNYADMPSLILLVGFMAGPYVFGIVGFILGPLILGLTYAIIKSLKAELEKDHWISDNQVDLSKKSDSDDEKSKVKVPISDDNEESSGKEKDSEDGSINLDKEEIILEN
ncbi:MAG: AI-2E family transporter [Methanobrevibacter sp.]|nr:AI-2E family transporter [Methanobrevibacter sp.]